MITFEIVSINLNLLLCLLYKLSFYDDKIILYVLIFLLKILCSLQDLKKKNCGASKKGRPLIMRMSICL